MLNKQGIARPIIFLLIFSLTLSFMRDSANQLKIISQGAGIIDLTLLDSLDTISQNIANLGDEGRRYYAQTFLLIDTIYPITYALFYASLLSFFVTKLKVTNKLISNSYYLPLLAALFDWLENIAIFRLLAAYPTRHDHLLVMFNSANMLKFASLYLAVLIILYSAFILTIRRFINR